MFDREDFEKVAKKGIERHKPLLHQLIAAAPSMETLTQSDEWNRYLTYLQTQILQAQKLQQTCITVLSDPNVTNHEDILKAKIAHASALSAEKAFTDAINIPKQIVDSGKSAEELLKQVDSN